MNHDQAEKIADYLCEKADKNHLFLFGCSNLVEFILKDCREAGLKVEAIIEVNHLLI